MDEILVIGRADEEIANIRTLLSRHFNDHSIRFSKPDKDSITRHLSGRTRLTVLNFDRLPEGFERSTNAVRKLGYDQSVLLLAKEAETQQIHSIQQQDGVSLLPKPCSNDDLTAFTEKILRKEALHQRYHARFNVKETVGFEAFGVSGMVAADMTKMSKGGAQFTLVGHHKLHPGDLLQVHIQLRHLDRYHRLPAQVVHCEFEEVAMSGDIFSVRWLPQIAQKQIA